jgi:hypothetical protein
MECGEASPKASRITNTASAVPLRFDLGKSTNVFYSPVSTLLWLLAACQSWFYGRCLILGAVLLDNAARTQAVTLGLKVPAPFSRVMAPGTPGNR